MNTFSVIAWAEMGDFHVPYGAEDMVVVEEREVMDQASSSMRNKMMSSRDASSHDRGSVSAGGISQVAIPGTLARGIRSHGKNAVPVFKW